MAALALRLMGDDLDDYCTDYRWMCEAFTEEEIFFRRTGSYRLRTFAVCRSSDLFQWIIYVSIR